MVPKSRLLAIRPLSLALKAAMPGDSIVVTRGMNKIIQVIDTSLPWRARQGDQGRFLVSWVWCSNPRAPCLDSVDLCREYGLHVQLLKDSPKWPGNLIPAVTGIGPSM